uniref:Uncharacterized protein n=1 Tax=Panagrolaimus davidi TaxID=227884 RepID=A0A914PK90_9BILA
MFKYSISETYPIPKPPTFYDSPLNAVGVDLGTTRSCTAVFKNNKIDVIAIDNSDRPLPSYIGYEEGKPICGSVVARRMPTFSQHAVFDIKRIIGKSYESIVIDPFWPFKVIKGNNQNVKIKTLDSAKTEIFLSPEEVSAVLLKHMKIKAEENKNSKLTEAVITVPIAFNQNQIDATLEAAALAGWETVHILPEPIAACFTYASENEIPKNSNILLFDFGGGTLDICIVRIENEQLRILKSSGDLFLGGRNFDTLIMNHFMLILKEIHKIDIRNNNYKKYKLMLKCQEIKHDLEAVQEILLDVGDFAPEIDANTPFNREQFKELSYEILVRLEAKIRETLDSINFAPHQINYVLQVGGGCRMAMIKELLKSIFPNSQHRSTVDPDWAVAYGAALYCCYKMTQDVTSHDEVFRHLPEPRDKITQEYIKKYQEDVPPKATNGIEKSKSKVSLIKEKFENISNKTKHAKTYNSTFSNTYTPPEVTQNAYIIDRIPKVECVGWDCCAGAIRIANVDTQNRPEPKMITNQTDAFRCQPTKSPYFFCVPRINDKYVIPSFRRLMKNNPRIEDLVENGIPPESQTYTHQQIMETIIQEMSKAFNVRNVTQKEAHICVPDAASLNHIQKLRQAFIEVFSKRQKAKDIPKPENPKLSDPPPALKGEVPLTKSNIFFIQRTAAAIQMYFHRRSGAKVYDHNREQFHRENRVVPHEKDQSILPRTVVVIAFGAGHFSSAIYKQQTFERYGIRHIFNQSDDDLGGEDLCYRLCEYVGTHLKLDEQGKEALKNPRLKKLLRNTMDQAKIDLSGFTPAT